MRVCPSVGPIVRPSIGAFQKQQISAKNDLDASHYIIGLLFSPIRFKSPLPHTLRRLQPRLFPLCEWINDAANLWSVFIPVCTLALRFISSPLAMYVSVKTVKMTHHNQFRFIASLAAVFAVLLLFLIVCFLYRRFTPTKPGTARILHHGALVTSHETDSHRN